MAETKFNRYLFEYPYDGATWAVEVTARDVADAEARMKAMPWARLKGEVAFSASVQESGFTRLLTKIFRRRADARR